jgi:hypothetical protein
LTSEQDGWKKLRGKSSIWVDVEELAAGIGAPLGGLISRRINMRWRICQQSKPALGTEREMTGFLFWPLVIDNETRWLETASWIETYEAIVDAQDYFGIPERGSYNKWVATRWIDTNKDNQDGK